MREPHQEVPQGLLSRSLLYAIRKAEKDEIDRHKWIESEKAGFDIGFDRAMLEWIRHHKSHFKITTRVTGGIAPCDCYASQ